MKVAVITSEGIPLDCTSAELRDEIQKRLRPRFWLFGTKGEMGAAIDRAFAEAVALVKMRTVRLGPEHDPKICPKCGQMVQEVTNTVARTVPPSYVPGPRP
jgi:hypothetical protein